MTPEWNVCLYDVNQQKFKAYNIMDYVYPIIKKLRKKDMNREEFLTEIKGELMYKFWSRSEYEMLLKPWIFSNGEEIKVDIYHQVLLNWDRFSDYCWDLYLGKPKG